MMHWIQHNRNTVPHLTTKQPRHSASCAFTPYSNQVRGRLGFLLLFGIRSGTKMQKEGLLKWSKSSFDVIMHEKRLSHASLPVGTVGPD